MTAIATQEKTANLTPAAEANPCGLRRIKRAVKRVAVFVLVLCMLAPVGGWAEVDIADLEARAEAGDVEAQFELGLVLDTEYHAGEYFVQKYHLKIGTVKSFHGDVRERREGRFGNRGVYLQQTKGDDTQSAYWYRRAAEQGHAKAQNNLGVSYADGMGVAQHFKRAFDWYRKSAEQGEAVAQYNLGVFYRHGRGGVTDRKQAYIWFNLAAANGFWRAENPRDRIASGLSQQDLEQAQEEASRLLDETRARVNDE